MVKKPDHKEVFRALRHVLENRPHSMKLYTKLHSLKSQEPVKGLLAEHDLIQVCHVAQDLLGHGLFKSTYSKYADLDDARAALEADLRERINVVEEIQKGRTQKWEEGDERSDAHSPLNSYDTLGMVVEAPIEKEGVASTASLSTERALSFKSALKSFKPRPNKDDTKAKVKTRPSESQTNDLPGVSEMKILEPGTVKNDVIPSPTPAQQVLNEDTRTLEVSDEEKITTQAAMNQAALSSQSDSETAKTGIVESEAVKGALDIDPTKVRAVKAERPNTDTTTISTLEPRETSTAASIEDPAGIKVPALGANGLLDITVTTRSPEPDTAGNGPASLENGEVDITTAETAESESARGGFSMQEVMLKRKDITANSPARSTPPGNESEDTKVLRTKQEESKSDNTEPGKTELGETELEKTDVSKSEPLEEKIANPNFPELETVRHELPNLVPTRQLLPVQTQETSANSIQNVSESEEIDIASKVSESASEVKKNTKSDVGEIATMKVDTTEAVSAKHESENVGTTNSGTKPAPRFTEPIETVLWKANSPNAPLEKNTISKYQSTKAEVTELELVKGKNKRRSGNSSPQPARVQRSEAYSETRMSRIRPLAGRPKESAGRQVELTGSQPKDGRPVKKRPETAGSPSMEPTKLEAADMESASVIPKRDKIVRAEATEGEAVRSKIRQEEREKTAEATEHERIPTHEAAKLDTVQFTEQDSIIKTSRRERRLRLSVAIEEKLRRVRSEQAMEERRLEREVFAAATYRTANQQTTGQVPAGSELAEQEAMQTLSTLDTESGYVKPSLENDKPYLDPDLEIDLSDLITPEELRENATIHVSPLPSFYLPYKDQHHITTRLQNTLEHSCFTYIRREHSALISKFRNIVECAEAVELHRYTALLSTLDFDDTAVSKLPRDIWKIWRSAEMIRHATVHRNRVPVQALKQFLSDAEALAGLLKDPEAAKFSRRLKNEVHQAVVGLKTNKILIERRLLDTLKDLAAKRAELDRIEREAVHSMIKSDEEYRTLVGANLVKAIEASSSAPMKQEEPKGLWGRLKSFFSW